MRRFPISFSQLLCLVVVGILLAPLSGCSKEEVKKVVKQIQEPIEEVVEKAPEVVPPKKVSQIEVSLGESDKVTAAGCFVTLNDFKNDLPTVLSVTSYQSADKEQFPSVMMQGNVDAVAMAALVNKPVPVELYVMSERDAAVWHTAPGQTVEIRLTAASDAEITGEIISGTLINSKSGESKKVTGKFDFVR